MANKTNKMTKSVKILWRCFWGGLLLFVLILLGANFGLFGKMPSMEDLQNPEADLASEIYTSDGKLMGKYYSENRSEVKYNEISPNIINGLIATEDERFKDHSGIDAKALARAVFSLGTQGGGSTISQQLAKMILNQGKGNIFRRSIDKLKEWIVAVKLERNFTKDEIITLYLNRAAWGNNYGIRNASITYFQKEPINLSVEESAVLVGMLKGFVYNPINHADRSRDRRNTVIDQMANAGYFTPDEAKKYKAKPLITSYKKIDDNVGIAPYFRTVLADKMKQWCKEHKNPKTGENYNLYRDGLRIYTTIDSRMQQYAEESVNQHMPVIQKKLDYLLKVNGTNMWKGHDDVIVAAMKYSERWKVLEEDKLTPEEIKKTFYTPVRMKVFAWNAKRELDTTMTPFDSIRYHKQLMQTSFVAMDPRSGEIKCWVGGIDFKWFKFDHVTAKRQVGSTFKPLLYTLAVQEAGYTYDTPVPGGTICLGGKCITGSGGTLANGLAFSKNAVAYRLMSVIGAPRTVEFAHKCGIESKLGAYPSIALGAAEIPMMEMLQAYSMFPNKGYNTKPLLVTRIEDKNGNLLEEFTTETKLLISESDAYTMVKLMEGVVQKGTGRSLNNYNIPAEKAGKTGTTNGNTDGWFIGYTPELLAGTWVGCDDQFLRIYAGTSGGNEMALPKWGFFMNKVYADRSLRYGKELEFAKPLGASEGIISADPEAFLRAVQQGDDSTNVREDQGSGDAGDFTDEADQYKEDLQQAPSKPDTGKNKPKTVMPAAIKPEDKNAKSGKPTKAKKTETDF